MKILSIIFCLLLIEKTYACECASRGEFKKEYALEYDYIFLAKIKPQVDTGIYELEIIEVFKGNPSSTIKLSDLPHFTCTPMVRVGETWLVYARQLSRNIIQLGPCDISRNIDGMGVPPPTPTSKNKKIQEKYLEELKAHKQQYKAALQNELQELRKLN